MTFRVISSDSSSTSTATQGSYNYKMFKCFNRKFKVTEAEPPADVRATFSTFSDGGCRMTADQLRLFLVKHQGEDATSATEDAERIVEEALLQRREKDGSSSPNRGGVGDGICLDEFFRFLLSCDLNGPINCKVKCRSLHLLFPGHHACSFTALKSAIHRIVKEEPSNGLWNKC